MSDTPIADSVDRRRMIEQATKETLAPLISRMNGHLVLITTFYLIFCVLILATRQRAPDPSIVELVEILRADASANAENRREVVSILREIMAERQAAK